MPASKTFAAFSCWHAPLVDKAAFNWSLRMIAERKPQVIVHLGDGLEADSASRWPSEATWTLEDEFESFNDHLRAVREVAGDAELVFIEGNHDANLLAANRIDKRLRGMADYRNSPYVPELQYWDTKTRYKYSRRYGVYRLGPVAFTHGFEHARNAGEAQSFLLGDPYGLLVWGHTHRPSAPRRIYKGDIPLPYWETNVGCLRNIDDVGYMERKRRHAWGQAMLFGETAITKSVRMSKNWDAELLVYRMFEEIVN